VFTIVAKLHYTYCYGQAAASLKAAVVLTAALLLITAAKAAVVGFISNIHHSMLVPLLQAPLQQ
jgi:hypothetical protein